MAGDRETARKLIAHTRRNKQMQMHTVLQQDFGDGIEQVSFVSNETCQEPGRGL